ncbi:hypothetical protein IGI04_011907 [Brassica rapa subsp. trilocularis]|uniref:Uncharacterized protein n=1 Tax=Brassica rapa subsp. trilocularis TaxID=1813537 RepID=A0ABQ7N4F0_BRACM|nr:hypothetical protein IGI04_011907 [Brassica rapa subsp. trilocularis]
MEEILVRIQHREEATVKREQQWLIYDFSRHKWRANATHYLGQAYFNLTGGGVAKKKGYLLDLGKAPCQISTKMNKTARIDIPSSSSPAPASADGELNEDDIFSIDITHAPKHSPSSSPAQHPPARQLQRTKSCLKNVEASGILAALPEPSGNTCSCSLHFGLLHSFLHASSSSARIIPSAPKPPQERVPFTASLGGGGRYPQSAPLQVPLAMRSRHKKEFKLTDAVVDEEEEEDEGERLPPHEIVARSLAQSSLLSCSVLEGAGRTLKGRDLRQVRNAVFRRTGFID